MKEGTYTVQSYNGKDAVLVHEDGTFEIVTKCEFPQKLKGTVFVGEVLTVKYVLDIIPNCSTDDERERSGYANESEQFKRMKDLEMKEAARRALYGGAYSLESAK